jgi:hypothetical protein
MQKERELQTMFTEDDVMKISKKEIWTYCGSAEYHPEGAASDVQ